MKKVQLYIVSLLLVFVMNSLCAEIIETPHFKDIEAYAGEGTLLLIDIDDTLLVPKQMVGCDEWFQNRFMARKLQGMELSSALEETLAEWEAVRHLTAMEIVESGTKDIIDSIQSRGALMMGLTTQGLALATRTRLQLLQQGIDLTITAPSINDHYFVLSNHGILYRNGILFTSGRAKGVALFTLLDTIGVSPKRLVFINDKSTHLKDVEEEAAKRGIDFVGLRYSYSDSRKAAYSQELADYQFSNSTFTHLLTDEEAKNEIPR